MPQSLQTFPHVENLLQHPHIWIGDSAATVHSSQHVDSIISTAQAPSGGVVGNTGESSPISKVGDHRGIVCDKHGVEIMPVRLQNVKGVQNSKFNLFSLTYMIKKGWTMTGTKDAIILTKKSNRTKLVFDIVIPTAEGLIFAIYIKPHSDEMAAIKTDAPSQLIKINPTKIHDLLGHKSDARTRASATSLGYEITRGKSTCESCAIGKARQKNVPKEPVSDNLATRPGERVGLDIFSIKGEKDGPTPNPRRHGRMMVDHFSGCGFLNFYTTKDGMVEPTLEKWNRWKGADKEVKYVRMDNAGENKTLKARGQSKDWKLNFKPEFTARNTSLNPFLRQSRTFCTSSTSAYRAQPPQNSLDFFTNRPWPEER